MYFFKCEMLGPNHCFLVEQFSESLKVLNLVSDTTSSHMYHPISDMYPL